jgi:hypothetical protein
LEERLGTAATTFEYHVHAQLQIFSDRTRISVVENDNAPVITITCEGGYAPLKLLTTIEHPAMFPLLPKTKHGVKDYFNTLARRTSPHERVQRWEVDLKQVTHIRGSKERSSNVQFQCESQHVTARDPPAVNVFIEVQPPVEIHLDRRHGDQGSTRVNADFGARYFYRFTVWCSGGSSSDYQVRGWIEDGSGIGVANQEVRGVIDRDHAPARDRVAFSVAMPKAKHTGEVNVILTCRDMKSGVSSEEFDVLYTIQRRHSSHHIHNSEERNAINTSPEPVPIPYDTHDGLRASPGSFEPEPAPTPSTSSQPGGLSSSPSTGASKARSAAPSSSSSSSKPASSNTNSGSAAGASAAGGTGATR